MKKFDVTKFPLHANQECILKRINELKSSKQLFSMKSETDDGLSSSSNFPERPTLTEIGANKPVLPEIEHLKDKISGRELDSLWAVLNRNADVFSKHKVDISCCNFVELEIEIEESSVPHREGARRMTPHKSEACRKETEMLMEYDMIEPSKSPWALRSGECHSESKILRKGLRVRAGIVPVEEDAVRIVQRDGHIPATDGAGTHECDKEVREPHHVLCR